MNAELLRELARIARSSELHDLRVGLTPDEVDALANMLEREHKEAERYRALKESVDEGELIVCYNDHHEGGDIGGPECIDDWCDARIETFGAARKGVSDE